VDGRFVYDFKNGRPNLIKALMGLLLVSLLGQATSLWADTSNDSFYTELSNREARYYLLQNVGCPWFWSLEDFNSEGIKINKFKVINGNCSSSNPENDFISFKFSQLKEPTIVAGDRSLYGVNLKDGINNVTLLFWPTETINKLMVNGSITKTTEEWNEIFENNKAETKANAMKFINAVYSYIHHPEWAEPEDPKVFKKVVKDFQAHHTKKPIPEEARKYFLQADSAANDKSYLEAIELYDQGLAIAPWAATAHYNLSMLIAGSSGSDYQSAIDEMNKYLLLNPKASDARDAQDQIYKWEEALKKRWNRNDPAAQKVLE